MKPDRNPHVLITALLLVTSCQLPQDRMAAARNSDFHFYHANPDTRIAGSAAIQGMFEIRNKCLVLVEAGRISTPVFHASVFSGKDDQLSPLKRVVGERLLSRPLEMSGAYITPQSGWTDEVLIADTDLPVAISCPMERTVLRSIG